MSDVVAYMDDAVTDLFVIDTLKLDPIVWVTDEFLANVHRLNPRIVTLVDDVLTINTGRKRVVYVIERDSYDFLTNAYRAHWPD